MADYATLLVDVPAWLQNDSTEFAEQVPTFISNGEARIYRDVNIPQLEAVTDPATLTADTGTLTFPSDLIAAREFIVQSNNARSQVILIQLPVGYQMYPSLTTTGVPRFYAVYSATQWRMFPIPDQNYPYEIYYRRKLPALSASNTTNWLTDNAYDLVLAAACCEGVRFILDDRQETLTKIWERKYQEALTSLNNRATTAAQDDYALPFGSPR